MTVHEIQRGLDIPIAGAASGAPVDLPRPATVAIDPRELLGFIPRLAAREGDVVQRGQPVMYHKFDHDLVVVSPTAGTVKEIQRGHRRVIEAFVLEPAAEDSAVQHKAWSLSELASISRDAALSQLKAGGGLALMRTRPLDHVPNAAEAPQAIVISATESGPLQAGPDVLLSPADHDALQAAIHVFKALTDGEVFLTLPKEGQAPGTDGLSGVTTATFGGPHPSGDPAVQVNTLCPPSGGRKVWYVKAWDAAVIGRLFLDGTYDGTRVYGAVGTAAATPRFVRTIQGAPVAHVVGETRGEHVRWINGSILTGRRTSSAGFAGTFARTVHVLPDEVERTILGWANPFNGMWSFHKAFLKAFGGAAPSDLRPGLYGGHRAIVPTGIHDQVIASPDIHPTFLFKSIMAGDLEGSIELGMLDLSMEEAALLSYICPSKIDYDVILREGLELYAKEA